ncbi:MAG: response regulator transcription factor [Burkholderiaceae bacterium]
MTQYPESWRVLIVEDDPDNAAYIADGFRAQGHLAVVCSDGPQALARVCDGKWGVIILDRMLPDGVDGLSLLAHWRKCGNNTPVLVLSALSALDDRVRGLKAGGDDYLTKPFAFAELAARAQALMRRTRHETGFQQLQNGDLVLDLVGRRVTRAGRPIALQPREFRLLTFFMLHSGQVLTRTMLLEAVWDYRFDPQTNVVDVQVSRLRTKIDLPDLTPLIHTIRGAGYRMAIDETTVDPPA